MINVKTRYILCSVACLPIFITGCNQPVQPETTTPVEQSSTAQPQQSAVSQPAQSVASDAPSTAQNLVEGRDYTLIKNPLPVEKPEQPEVREFFWYGCGHCYSLEPHLNNWLATKPADVNFIRTPAALNPVWEQNARAYYTVEGMGKMTEALHAQLFDVIHKQNQQVFDQPSLAAFYTKAGVDLAAFNNAYNSFAVSAKINQSKQLAQRAELSGVPAIVVNGRYLVSGEPQQMISTISALIEKDRPPATR